MAEIVAMTLDLTVFSPIAPWYDELWNLYPSPRFFGIDQNIWSGCGNAMCLNLLGHQIPILSGPYHGLIKTLIYIPLVAWGNIPSIRWLNLGVYLLPIIYLLFQRQYFGKVGIWVIACAYYLLVPSLFIEAIFDQGQFVFANGFLLIAAIELVKYTYTHSARSAAIALLFCGLAVYEKLTNLPVATVIGVLAFTYLIVQKRYRYLLYIALAGLAMFIPYAVFITKLPDLFFGMTAAPKSSFIENFNAVTQGAYYALFQTSTTLNGFFNQSFLVPASSLALSLFVMVYLLALAQGFRGLIHNRASKRGLQNTLADNGILLAPVLALVMQSCLDGLNRPWHLYQLSSLICIPFAYLCLHAKNHWYGKGDVRNQRIAEDLSDQKPTQKDFQYFILPMLLMLGVINFGSLLIPTWSMGRAHPYDNALFTSVLTIQDYRAQPPNSLPTPISIVCLDYGICSNLVYLLGPKYRVLADWAHSPVERICQDLSRNAKQSYILVTRVVPRKATMTDYEKLMAEHTQFFEDHCSSTFEIINTLSTSPELPNYRMYYHRGQ